MQGAEREQFIARLYFSCHDTLEKMCYRRLNYDPARAQMVADCVQDSFLAADRHYQKLKDHPNPEGWLMLTCQNRLKDALRRDRTRRMREVFSLDEEGAQPMADPHSALDRWADRQEDGEMVQRIVSLLSDGEKRVMKGYFVQGHSMDEVAKQEQSTVSAVKSAISRIRQKARRMKEEK